MQLLEQLKGSGQRYSLDELVVLVNSLLPRLLPGEIGSSKLKEEVNPRLVRNLATLGLVDEALREGREARYGYRHLLQLLVTRRLMAEGYTTSAIKKLLVGVDDDHLESLLLRGGQPRLATAAPAVEEPNEALQFLRHIAVGGRSSPMPPPAASPPGPASPPVAAAPEVPTYHRVTVCPGLELHVADNFQLPLSPHEREALQQEIMLQLKQATRSNATHRRRGR